MIGESSDVQHQLDERRRGFRSSNDKHLQQVSSNQSSEPKPCLRKPLSVNNNNRGSRIEYGSDSSVLAVNTPLLLQTFKRQRPIDEIQDSTLPSSSKISRLKGSIGNEHTVTKDACAKQKKCSSSYSASPADIVSEYSDNIGKSNVSSRKKSNGIFSGSDEIKDRMKSRPMYFRNGIKNLDKYTNVMLEQLASVGEASHNCTPEKKILPSLEGSSKKIEDLNSRPTTVQSKSMQELVGIHEKIGKIAGTAEAGLLTGHSIFNVIKKMELGMKGYELLPRKPFSNVFETEGEQNGPNIQEDFLVSDDQTVKRNRLSRSKLSTNRNNVDVRKALQPLGSLHSSDLEESSSVKSYVDAVSSVRSRKMVQPKLNPMVSKESLKIMTMIATKFLTKTKTKSGR